MNEAVVLNHLSLPFLSQDDANVGMLDFIKVLYASKKYDLNILLVDDNLDKSLMTIPLCKDYCISDWYAYAKTRADLYEERRILLSVLTRKELSVHCDEKYDLLGTEIAIQGYEQIHSVFSAAYLLKTFLLSFSSLEIWKKATLDITVTQLDENAEVISVPAKLLNISSVDHITQHQENIALKKTELAIDVPEKEFISSFKTVYPYLRLTGKVCSFFYPFSYHSGMLNAIKSALSVLNTFTEKWQKGEYLDYQHQYLSEEGLSSDISGESSSTTKDKKLRGLREFSIEESVNNVYFQNHIKLGDVRIHFYPEPTKKVIYIGYIGEHLPTVRHK